MCQKHKQGGSRGSCRECLWCLFPWHRTIWAYTSLKRSSAELCGWWWDTTLHEQRKNHAFWSSQCFAIINILVSWAQKIVGRMQETLSSKGEGKSTDMLLWSVVVFANGWCRHLPSKNDLWDTEYITNLTQDEHQRHQHFGNNSLDSSRIPKIQLSFFVLVLFPFFLKTSIFNLSRFGKYLCIKSSLMI